MLSSVRQAWQKFNGVWHYCHCRSPAVPRRLEEGQPVRTGSDRRTRGYAMELLFLLFFLFTAAASVAGLTADSRDGADWTPSDDGFRAPRRT